MRDDIYEAAAAWHGAQLSEDMDWAAFAEWLGADPRHRVAYDDIALLDDRVMAAREDIVRHLPVNDTAPALASTRRLGRIAAMLAIVLGAAVLFGIWRLHRRDEAAVTTFAAKQGQLRQVSVGEGASAVLASGSRLELRQGQLIRLAGAAWFDIRHDPARPMTIDVAGLEIRDVGTQFDVNSDGDTVRVAVAEGAVAIIVKATGAKIDVVAGHAAVADMRSGAIELQATPPVAVGAWRSGHFSYDRVPLSLVAADIARYTGQPIVVDPAVAKRRFSGVLGAGDRMSMIEALRQLAGLSVQREGDAVRLVGSAGS